MVCGTGSVSYLPRLGKEHLCTTTTYNCNARHTWISHIKIGYKPPGTQMTLVLAGVNGFVLEGWPSKKEVLWALGISISYVYIDKCWNTKQLRNMLVVNKNSWVYQCYKYSESQVNLCNRIWWMQMFPHSMLFCSAACFTNKQGPKKQKSKQWRKVSGANLPDFPGLKSPTSTRQIYPRHPKIPKYLVRCLEPLITFSGDVWEFKYPLTMCLDV